MGRGVSLTGLKEGHRDALESGLDGHQVVDALLAVDVEHDVFLPGLVVLPQHEDRREELAQPEEREEAREQR